MFSEVLYAEQSHVKGDFYECNNQRRKLDRDK